MPVIWTCCHPCFLRLLKVETGVTQHGDNVANWIRLVFVLPDRERCHSGDSGVRALGRYCWWKKSGTSWKAVQLIIHRFLYVFIRFYTSQVVQDFFHQHYHNMVIFHVWTSSDGFFGRSREDTALPTWGLTASLRHQRRSTSGAPMNSSPSGWWVLFTEWSRMKAT